MICDHLICVSSDRLFLDFLPRIFLILIGLIPVPGLLGIIFLLENFSRKKAQYHTPAKGGIRSKTKIKLNGYKSFLATAVCFSVFFISFVFPISQMLYWTLIFPKHLSDLNVLQLSFNTLLLVVLSCLVLTSFSFLSNYGNRISRSKLLDLLTTFSISGYAIPGIILAVAFITFVSFVDLHTGINIKSIFRQ